MARLERYLDIVDLFGETKSDWTIAEIAFSLDVPISTVYRIVRELVAARMLEQSTEANYRLGAAFIDYDRRVRLTDSLIRMSGAILQDVSAQVPVPCAVVLARLYGDTVMCVADTRTAGRDIPTSYERGRPQPLTRGATSKMILAQLPARRLSRLLATFEGTRSAGSAILELRKDLLMARRCGYIITRGEVDPGLVGIAAPVSNPEQAIAASLSLIVPASGLTDVVEHRLVLLATTAANLLSERLRPPKASPARTEPVRAGALPRRSGDAA